MNRDEALTKLLSPLESRWVALFAALLLAAIYIYPEHLKAISQREEAVHQELRHALEQATLARDRVASIDTLKTLDLEQMKAGLSGNAQSQKALFESGLSLQEERRLLDKQLEIMTTTLFVNPALQRIFLLRADQPLQSYLLSYIPLKSFSGSAATLPGSVKIISKERFAHPERGKSEQVNGTLQWIPPQVGNSVRSKALGEFVMFTNSALILHGPSVNDEAHEKYPHVCLGLDLESARRLYRASFIGTRITLSQVTIEPVVPSHDPAAPGPL